MAACGSGETDWIACTYDQVGNRLTESRSAGTTTFAYDPNTDRLISASGPSGTISYGYDAVGNTTSAGSSTYAWNAAGMLTSATTAGTTTSYSYDGDNRRLSALTGNGTAGTRFLWDPASYDLAAERDAAGNPLRSYVPGGLGVTDAAGVTQFLHGDALGSIQATTNAAGDVTSTFDYEPYGGVKAQTGTAASALQFTGALGDPTGLVHLRTRQYDPTTGRFLTPDPLGGGYRYANANPMRFTDPLGLWPTYRGAMSIVARTAGALSFSALVLAAFSSETIVGGIAFGTIAVAATAVSAAAYASIAVYDCLHHTNPKGSCGTELLGAGVGVATALYGGSALSGSAEEAINDTLKATNNYNDAVSSAAGHLPGSAAPQTVLKAPTVGSTKLQNIVNDLYKGTTNPARVGTGTTADALRYELSTGQQVFGKSHLQKAQDSLRGLENWLKANPSAPYSDRLVARSLADDLLDALGQSP